MPGKVFLVGAGPGDPGLLTARALQLIAAADAIVYDRLIPSAALAGARSDAVLDYVGKGHSGDSSRQLEIDRRLVELAGQHELVVRLKGGDPFVFGRGAEEAAALTAAGVEFEVVPGVTSGVAAAAYAGIPVTHRSHASAVAFVTGSEDPTRPQSMLDWEVLARFPGTLVFFMGVKGLAQISARLIEHGRPPDQPAAAVERGTTPRQRTIVGTLESLPELAREAELAPPALTVIGEVVQERETIAWFERRPLLGRSVAVTRTRARSSELAARLFDLGADVTCAPAIRTEDVESPELARALAQLDEYDLIVFGSANAVDAFFAALQRQDRDSRALSGIEVAAVGTATAAALAGRGINPGHLPQRQTSEGLLERLQGVAAADGRVLIPRAQDGGALLVDGLRSRGSEVDAPTAYRTWAEALTPELIEQVAAAEFVTFASGSAVHSIVAALGGTEALERAELISIGPVTTSALAAHGLTPSAEAATSNIDGLIEALLLRAAIA